MALLVARHVGTFPPRPPFAAVPGQLVGRRGRPFAVAATTGVVATLAGRDAYATRPHASDGPPSAGSKHPVDVTLLDLAVDHAADAVGTPVVDDTAMPTWEGNPDHETETVAFCRLAVGLRRRVPPSGATRPSPRNGAALRGPTRPGSSAVALSLRRGAVGLSPFVAYHLKRPARRPKQTASPLAMERVGGQVAEAPPHALATGLVGRPACRRRWPDPHRPRPAHLPSVPPLRPTFDTGAAGVAFEMERRPFPALVAVPLAEEVGPLYAVGRLGQATALGVASRLTAATLADPAPFFSPDLGLYGVAPAVFGDLVEVLPPGERRLRQVAGVFPVTPDHAKSRVAPHPAVADVAVGGVRHPVNGAASAPAFPVGDLLEGRPAVDDVLAPYPAHLAVGLAVAAPLCPGVAPAMARHEVRLAGLAVRDAQDPVKRLATAVGVANVGLYGAASSRQTGPVRRVNDLFAEGPRLGTWHWLWPLARYCFFNSKCVYFVCPPLMIPRIVSSIPT